MGNWTIYWWRTSVYHRGRLRNRINTVRKCWINQGSIKSTINLNIILKMSYTKMLWNRELKFCFIRIYLKLRSTKVSIKIKQDKETKPIIHKKKVVYPRIRILYHSIILSLKCQRNKQYNWALSKWTVPLKVRNRAILSKLIIKNHHIKTQYSLLKLIKS